MNIMSCSHTAFFSKRRKKGSICAYNDGGLQSSDRPPSEYSNTLVAHSERNILKHIKSMNVLFSGGQLTPAHRYYDVRTHF